MTVIYCSDPLDRSAVDEPYKAEYAAARFHGLRTTLFNYEALVNDGDAERAVKRVPVTETPEPTVYRGWMLRSSQYALLHAALQRRGVRLINDPVAYSYCHELANWYHHFSDITPRTAIIPLEGPPDFAVIRNALRPFSSSAIVLKDYVKSQKHYWNEACFIPDASDSSAVERITRRFLELQGDSLVGGLVYREFVELEPVGAHPKSGMPMTLEYRIFYFDGQPMYAVPYWETADYKDSSPPLDRFSAPAARVKSRFFTMDIAKATSGDWIMVELGDGQVAGLPENADCVAFYSELSIALALHS
ncbi:MAG TPA: ATP-grasp domain-containing protein [Planctomycetota bacterium]|nr:ATP-grasp domain-containing protein [Planctomycetota bacterium]